MGHLHSFDREAPVISRWRAILTSVLLSTFFLVAYGATNWFTATRDVDAVWMYEWEHHIPFIALMILPYMSIDLFFVAAPFVCSDRDELRTLIRRIVLAVSAACTIFLIMPLKMGMERPAADGWLGVVFDWFRSMDQPHNLFPSLHIALSAILLAVYARHTSGLLRWITIVWFGFVAASTLLTYQHHVLDVVGGLALGIVCIYMFPYARSSSQSCANLRVAGYYALGAVALQVVAVAFRDRLGWLMLWPATAVAIVCAGYCGIGPSIYQKHNGRLSLAARILLGPSLLGQWLSR